SKAFLCIAEILSGKPAAQWLQLFLLTNCSPNLVLQKNKDLPWSVQVIVAQVCGAYLSSKSLRMSSTLLAFVISMEAEWKLQKNYELLRSGVIGNITSVDFHWYLDIYHGADYFRRWHRLRKNSGSLLVHKASHHFDLLNWWIDSEPEEVFAYGSLDFYGKNNSFRHTECRSCPYKDKCQFYFDITKNQRYVDLYVNNQKYDGYLRDGCVWREDIDIFDKMAVQMKYANNVQVCYSLTAYNPYEGY